MERVVLGIAEVRLDEAPPRPPAHAEEALIWWRMVRALERTGAGTRACAARAERRSRRGLDPRRFAEWWRRAS